jgi:uncharacterized protein involved in outer membrane biogenesis
MGREKKKKKGLGWLGKLVIFLLVLVVGAYVAAKLFFPAEKVRTEIIKRASAALGRTVELDGVSFSILPGPTLELQGLRVFNPEDFPGGALASVDRLKCRLKILPLLRKQFVFSEIIVKHPVIDLRKTADGKTNYRFQIAAGEKGVETPLGAKDTISSAEAALAVFAFDWAEIANGDLTYQDDSAQVKAVLSNFSLETRMQIDPAGKKGRAVGTLKLPTITGSFLPEKLPLAVSIAYNADIDFQNADLLLDNTTLEINGIPFEVKATVRNLMAPSSIFVALEAKDVSLEPLVQYIPQTPKFNPQLMRIQGRLSGRVETTMEMVGERTPYFRGGFTFNDLTIGYQTVSTRAHFSALRLDFDADSLSFASQGGRVAEQDFLLEGKIKNLKNPVFDVRAKGSYDLTGLLPFLPAKYTHEVSGMARFDLTARGQKSEWAKSDLFGRLAIDKLYYDNDSLTSPLQRLDMILDFSGQEAIIDSLYAEYPGIRMNLKGTVKNGFAHLLQPRQGHKRPYVDFSLHAPLINYDILVPVDKVPPPGELPAPVFVPDIEAGGKVSIDTLVYSKVEFTNLTGTVTYADRLITFKNAAGRLYSGSVQGDGSVDIANFYEPVVACSFVGKDIEANDFLTRFANVDGHLFGKFNLDGTLTGRGSEAADFIRSLTATGNLNMKEGRLVNFDLIEKLAGQFGFATFQEESLRDLAGAVTISDGKLVMDGTRLLSKMGDWNVGGTVGFLDKTLNLRMGVYLSPEYSKNINLLGGLLKDDKGRVKLNFTVGGTYDQPTIANLSTDQNAVQKKTEDALKKEADNLLKKLFKKP